MGTDISDSSSETLDPTRLIQHQLDRFQMMLPEILKSNGFYRKKLRAGGVKNPEEIQTFDDFRGLPFTTKDELSTDQRDHPPYGTNLTLPVDRYIRIHQTSGTRGDPLRWLDTEESWGWWGRCWEAVYRAAGIGSGDRIFFAFSFGPFIGFWSGYEGARSLGMMSIPGGGMSSEQRLKAIFENEASVLISTPTYALHLAEVARREGRNPRDSKIRITIHAGEAGASLPGTRKRIEEAWDARCYDHAGATEVGAWGFGCEVQSGLHLNEGEFIGEVIDPSTEEPANDGELVITNLGRVGSPVIRYRTGDRVQLEDSSCPCGRTFRRFARGVTGRIDDALTVRGNTIFPSALEDIVRGYPDVEEFSVNIYRRKELDEMDVRIELHDDRSGTIVSDLARSIRNAFGFRARVIPVPQGTLPRFEHKANRFKDDRKPG